MYTRTSTLHAPFFTPFFFSPFFLLLHDAKVVLHSLRFPFPSLATLRASPLIAFLSAFLLSSLSRLWNTSYVSRPLERLPADSGQRDGCIYDEPAPYTYTHIVLALEFVSPFVLLVCRLETSSQESHPSCKCSSAAGRTEALQKDVGGRRRSYR